MGMTRSCRAHLLYNGEEQVVAREEDLMILWGNRGFKAYSGSHLGFSR